MKISLCHNFRIGSLFILFKLFNDKLDLSRTKHILFANKYKKLKKQFDKAKKVGNDEELEESCCICVEEFKPDTEVK